MSNVDNHITITEILHQNISKPYNVLQWEPVKRTMTYIDFVTIFPRAERIKHSNFTEINTNTGHTHAIGQEGSKSKDQILTTKSQREHAKENLKKFILDKYNIELIGPQTVHVPVCHLCEHNSKINEKDSTKHTCTNQFHVYFGTVSENQYDIDPVVKSAASSTASKSPKSPSQIREKCPYCEWETNEFSLGKHIKACHFNPTSKHYLTPITHPYTKNVYQQQGLGHKLIELELMINQVYNQRHS